MKSIHHDPDMRFQDAKSMINDIQNHYQDFKNRKKSVCKMTVDDLPLRIKKEGSVPAILRANSELILAKHAKLVFNIDDSHRPLHYFEKNIELAKIGVVIDKTTNLVWQQSGSESPLQWEQARQYITTLNQQRSGDYENWRLPTINELLSLLNPPPPGEDFCFQSHMSSVQKWIWSCDTRSKRAAWFVDVEMCFVSSSDILDCYYVKAVCSI